MSKLGVGGNLGDELQPNDIKNVTSRVPQINTFSFLGHLDKHFTRFFLSVLKTGHYKTVVKVPSCAFVAHGPVSTRFSKTEVGFVF